MINGAIEPSRPSAVRVDWMWNAQVERGLDDAPDLLTWAS